MRRIVISALLLLWIPVLLCADEARESSRAALREATLTLQTELEKDPSSTEPARLRALEQVRETLSQLERWELLESQQAQFEAAITAAPLRTREFERRFAELPKEIPSASEGLSLSGARERLDEVRSRQAAAVREREATRADVQVRQDRRRLLPEETQAARMDVARFERQLTGLPAASDATLAGKTRSLLGRSSLQAAHANSDRLASESRSYDARDRLLQLRQDIAEAEERLAQAESEQLVAMVERLERQEATSGRERAAQLRTELAPWPAAREIADVNYELVNRAAGPDGIIARVADATRRLADDKQRLDRLREERSRVDQHLKVAGLTGPFGRMLRRQRAELPETRSLQSMIRKRQDTIATLQLELLDLRDVRANVTSLDDGVPALMRTIDAPADPLERVSLERHLREVAKDRRANLDTLILQYGLLLDRLVELDALQTQLIKDAGSFREFIDENVLWSRGARVLGVAELSDFLHSAQRIAQLGWHPNVIVEPLFRDVVDSPFSYIAAVLVLLFLIYLRRVSHQRLRLLAAETTDRPTDAFLLSAYALPWTLLSPLPVPALLGFLSVMLTNTVTTAPIVGPAVSALRWSAVVLYAVNLVRGVCREQGLGPVHFRWPADAMPFVRRQLRRWTITALPLFAIVMALEERPGAEGSPEVLERVLLIAFLLLTAISSWRLLRPNSVLLKDSEQRAADSLLMSGRWIWFATLVAVPLLIASAAIAGYHFTAMQISQRYLITLLLAAGLLIVRSALRLWLNGIRQKFLLQRLRERKRKEPGTDESLGQLSMAEVRRQSQSLVRWVMVVAGTIGLWLVWADLLPALAILQKVTIWGTSVEDGGTGRVALSSFVLAIVVITLTSAAAKNLPGLLQVISARWLHLDAGARYAAAQVARYVIIGVGVLTSAYLVGFQWSSVQWLLAALGVGLGFGLQEIFANFISGIILLFERPIRIGDIVTIGNVDGTVTRIRMRATTIMDFDRKELIVPNKEFITGRLLNWTLTDDIVRLRVPVGIAYGSDTALAKKLMLEAAHATRLVVDDPAPQVWYRAFGDSTLDFEIRVFVHGVDPSLGVIDELHTRIDAAFRQHGIEISFPQRDLHIRSIAASIPVRVESSDLEHAVARSTERGRVG